MILTDSPRARRAAAAWVLVLCLIVASIPAQAQTNAVQTPTGLQIQVPRLGKFEAAFKLTDATGNPFDPAENDVDAHVTDPNGAEIVVPAFWDSDTWNVRLSPTKVGHYRYYVTRNGSREPLSG